MALMEERQWTGNVRELKAVIERNVAQAFLKDESLSTPISQLQLDPFEGPYRLRDIAQSTPIYKERFAAIGSAPDIGPPQNPPPQEINTSFSERVMIFERRLIDEALQISDGHQGKAAEYLELT